MLITEKIPGENWLILSALSALPVLKIDTMTKILKILAGIKLSGHVAIFYELNLNLI